MCIICEHQLQTKASSATTVSVSDRQLMNAPSVEGKPWSEEFLTVKAQIENRLPETVH